MKNIMDLYRYNAFLFRVRIKAKSKKSMEKLRSNGEGVFMFDHQNWKKTIKLIPS